jgi:hypothetical protein
MSKHVPTAINMTAPNIAVLSYIVGAALIGLMIKYRRLSLMISWPYLLYGFGFVIPAAVGTRPELSFASGLYSDENLIRASLASMGAVLVFLLCDLAILGKTNLSSILSRQAAGPSSIAKVVNNWSFGVAASLGVGAFSVLYYLAWKTGEIGGEYTFIGIEYAHYVGPLMAALESLLALALLYVYALASLGPIVRRRKIFEVLFIGCLIARAIPGGRFGFVKSTMLCLMLVFLIHRPKAKHILVGILIIASIYGAATQIGFARTGQARSGDWFDYAFFLVAESYFSTLPVMIASNNLTNPTYQLGLPIAIIVYLLPRFAFNKVEWSESFYNHNLFTPDGDPQSLSPVGGMPFLADSMIAYGPMFLLPVAILASGVFFLFRRANFYWRALLMLSIMSGSHQLWRESYANGIKTILEPYLLQYLVLWFATFTGLVIHSNRAGQLAAWRAKYRAIGSADLSGPPPGN